jgi:hypothetical protein
MGKISSELSVGGEVEVNARFLRPKDFFRKKLLGAYDTARYTGVVITGQAEKSEKKLSLSAVVLRHEDFPAGGAWAPAGLVKIKKRGPPPFFVFACSGGAPRGE